MFQQNSENCNICVKENNLSKNSFLEKKQIFILPFGCWVNKFRLLAECYRSFLKIELYVSRKYFQASFSPWKRILLSFSDIEPKSFKFWQKIFRTSNLVFSKCPEEHFFEAQYLKESPYFNFFGQWAKNQRPVGAIVSSGVSETSIWVSRGIIFDNFFLRKLFLIHFSCPQERFEEKPLSRKFSCWFQIFSKTIAALDEFFRYGCQNCIFLVYGNVLRKKLSVKKNKVVNFGQWA